MECIFRARAAIFLILSLYVGQISGSASDRQTATLIDSYLQPYVQTRNFSGVVLVHRNGKVVFQKAYGFSDRERRIPVRPDTRFHIASLSMQFTAAAILRLVDKGSLSLDSGVGEYIRGIPGADKITVRDLLTQRSGLPDINDLPDYNDILQHHQTPASLVVKIEGRPLLFEPGSKFLHEEHSAYNVLALILEKKTGLTFPAAMKRLLFDPAALGSSGVDDDSLPHAPKMAFGYQPEGVSGLQPAQKIHWSAKTGNASVYTTVADEAKFVHALFEGRLLEPASLNLILDTSPRVGYGWFRVENKRFNQVAYYCNGRSPGYASFVLYLPREHLTVVAFSNIYSSATTTMGYDIAAISLNLPYTPFQPRTSRVDLAEFEDTSGIFKFGSDFYQPNATITLAAQGSEFSLRWPSGNVSPLIPLDRDHFVDRSYWEQVTIERDTSGQPLALVYGNFRGTAVKHEP